MIWHLFFTITTAQLSLAIANFQLHLLHNNDMHARFEEINQDTNSWYCENSSSCVGGFARIKQAANQFAKQAENKNMATIFLNAGDTFQGTPYYTLEKWKIVASLVNGIGFDVTCLGNHEFDDGIDDLIKYLNHLQTPVVACNLDLETETRLRVPNLKPSVIIHIGTKPIGVIGYLTPSTMETSNTDNLKIFDEISCIRKEAQRLRSIGVKIIIALGHSGIDRDKEIAEEVEEISLIVGGHSHTMMYTPKENPPSIETPSENYPYIVTQKSGKQVPIVQAYAYTKYLGRLFLEFDDDGNVISAEGNPVLLDSSIPKDPNINNLVKSWTNPLKDLLMSVKGYLRTPLLRSNISALEFESNTGNLITDALLYYSVKQAKKNNVSTWTNAPVAIYNRASIRCDLVKEGEGAVTLGDLYLIMPFENPLYEVQLSGTTLLKALENTVTKNYANEPYPVLDFAGMKVVYDLSQPIGCRVSSVSILCKECLVPRYEELKLDQIYTVLMPCFLLKRKNIFAVFQKESLNKTKLNKTDTAAVVEYIEQIQYIYSKLEGRLSVIRVGEATTSHWLAYILIMVFCAILMKVLFFLYNICKARTMHNNNYYQRLDS